jgi:hypothetical protein
LGRFLCGPSIDDPGLGHKEILRRGIYRKPSQKDQERRKVGTSRFAPSTGPNNAASGSGGSIIHSMPTGLSGSMPIDHPRFSGPQIMGGKFGNLIFIFDQGS